eukprot:5597355-Pleurochrysis_carterae.AAC.1
MGHARAYMWVDAAPRVCVQARDSARVLLRAFAHPYVRAIRAACAKERGTFRRRSNGCRVRHEHHRRRGA